MCYNYIAIITGTYTLHAIFQYCMLIYCNLNLPHTPSSTFFTKSFHVENIGEFSLFCLSVRFFWGGKGNNNLTYQFKFLGTCILINIESKKACIVYILYYWGEFNNLLTLNNNLLIQGKDFIVEMVCKDY